MFRSAGRALAGAVAAFALITAPSAYGDGDGEGVQSGAEVSATSVVEASAAVPKELKKMCDTISWYISAGKGGPCSSKLINAVAKCVPSAKQTRGPFGVGETNGEYYFAYCTRLYDGSGMWYGHSWLSEYKDTWLYPKSISRAGTVDDASRAVQPMDEALERTLRRLVNAQLTRFDEYAFSDVISLGSPSRYRIAMDALDGVHVWPLVGWQYDSVAMFIPSGAGILGVNDNRIYFDSDPSNVNPASEEYLAVMGTAWHELTHKVEELHGDFIDVNAGKADFQERNVEYMEEVIRALQRLVEMETLARAGAPVSALRARWQGFISGMAKAPKMPSPSKFPVDLVLLRRWTGFNVDPIAVFRKYASGKALPGRAGELLDEAVTGRKPVPPPDPEDVGGQDWTVSDWLSGTWASRTSTWGWKPDVNLRQVGTVVTGTLTNAPGVFALRVTEDQGNNPPATLAYLQGTFTYRGELTGDAPECSSGTVKFWFETMSFRMFGAYFCGDQLMGNLELHRQ